MPSLKRIYETVLYARDLQAAERFYTEVLGLAVLQKNDLFIVLRCGDDILLIFDPEKSEDPGRSVPSHGARGPGHIAFSLEPEKFDAWRSRLEEHGVEIEDAVRWNTGGRSLYFRDPAGNSVELAPPGIWKE